jgi:hypothetical protein
MTVARRGEERRGEERRGEGREGGGVQSSWQCIGGSGTVQKLNPVLWDSYKDSEMAGSLV